MHAIIEQMHDYIEESGARASKTFENLQMSHNGIFEGIKFTLTPKMCSDIYRDILENMMNKGAVISQKYGLLAIIIPSKTEDGVELSIELGMAFPADD